MKTKKKTKKLSAYPTKSGKVFNWHLKSERGENCHHQELSHANPPITIILSFNSTSSIEMKRAVENGAMFIVQNRE